MKRLNFFICSFYCADVVWYAVVYQRRDTVRGMNGRRHDFSKHFFNRNSKGFANLFIKMQIHYIQSIVAITYRWRERCDVKKRFLKVFFLISLVIIVQQTQILYIVYQRFPGDTPDGI